MTLEYWPNQGSGGRTNKLTACPCGYEFKPNEERGPHFLEAHGPADFGLSPLGESPSDVTVSLDAAAEPTVKHRVPVTDGGTSSSTRDRDDSLNAAIRSVDLRIAIGEHCGFDFLSRARASSSNSLAAIYFTRPQVDQIATDFGVGTNGNMGPLRDAIRERIGCGPRGGREFDWVELRDIAAAAEIPIDDDLYYDVAADPDPEPEPDEPDPPDDSGVDWGVLADGE